jgi:hypothetical protein
MAPPRKTDEEKRASRRAYYERTREEHLARARAWSAANPEGRKTIQKRYRDRNQEKTSAAQRARREANPENARAIWMRARHGRFAEADYATMWNAQNGCCYLCGRDLAGLDVIIEHDHRCCPQGKSCRNCRRGLSCKDCNSAIGLAGDDPGRLRRMADALEAAQQRVAAVAQLELLPETGS